MSLWIRESSSCKEETAIQHCRYLHTSTLIKYYILIASNQSSMFRFCNFQLFQKRNFNFDTYKKVYNDLKGIHPKYQKYLKFGFDFVVAVAVVNIVAWSIGSPSICLGPSMLPTINVEYVYALILNNIILSTYNFILRYKYLCHCF